jgi:XisH protein
MPAKDRYHDTVIRALIKDGWTITAQQVAVAVPGRRLWIDLRAIKTSDSMVVLIEVKGFEKMPSPVDYLAAVVGQYVLYRAALDFVGLSTPLYLAVPTAAYEGILGEALGKQAVEIVGIRIVLFDPITEEIVQWIP